MQKTVDFIGLHSTKCKIYWIIRSMKILKDQTVIALFLYIIIIFAAKLVYDRLGQDKNKSETEKR